MTAIISYLKKGRTGRNMDSGVNQIHAGYLELYNNERKQKWVIFEEIKSEGPRRYQLTVCPKNNGVKSKGKCYELDDDHFIGIEEGNVKQTASKEAYYFVIFLTSEKLIFQTKDKREADSWCRIVKEHLTHGRWLVQLQNDDNKLEQCYLHVTNSFVSLTQNPPEVYKRWNVVNIGRVNCEGGGYLSITVLESGSNSGYFQIKTQKSTDMTRIKEAIDKAKKEMDHREVEEKLIKGDRMTHHPPHQTSSVTQVMTNQHKVPCSPFTAPANPRVPDVVNGEKRDFEVPARLEPFKPQSHTAPVRNRSMTSVPDVIDGGCAYITSSSLKTPAFIPTGSEDEIKFQPRLESAVSASTNKPYYNFDGTFERPPPLPIRDDLRHFESVTLGDTIEAIRKKQVCFRDSLNIKPSKRHQLFAVMDATGWWKHLAAAIGLDVSNIDVVESLAPKYNCSWTEMVVYHWECTRNPTRICSIREMQNIAQETNRLDLLNMLTEE